MAGLIQTGTGYETSALSGFVRESALQEQIDLANEQLRAQRNIQQAKMGAESTVVGGVLGYAGAAEMGAFLGTEITPGLGTAIGAGLGFLFSRLF
jgi:hypothetical protein